MQPCSQGPTRGDLWVLPDSPLHLWSVCQVPSHLPGSRGSRLAVRGEIRFTVGQISPEAAKAQTSAWPAVRPAGQGLLGAAAGEPPAPAGHRRAIR